MTWQEHALCAGASGFHDPSPEGIEAALALCNGHPCPVRQSCFEWAAAQKGSNWGYDGVAGGRFWVNGRPVRPPQPVAVRLALGLDRELMAGHSKFVHTPKDEHTDELREIESQYQAARYQIRKMRKAAA